MQTLCGVVAVVMAILWINWVLALTLALVAPADGGRWLAFAVASVVTAPILYGGFRLLESQQRT